MRRRVDPALPVLFLDFDGVLHPHDVYRVRGRIVLRRDGLNLFEWSPLLITALAPHPSVQIVLSTSWVRVLGFDNAKAYLPAVLAERVVGATWHSRMSQAWWERASRDEQIYGYVRRHACTRWLAIDDDHETWPTGHRERLLALDGDFGLAEPGKLDEFRDKLTRLREM